MTNEQLSKIIKVVIVDSETNETSSFFILEMYLSRIEKYLNNSKYLLVTMPISEPFLQNPARIDRVLFDKYKLNDAEIEVGEVYLYRGLIYYVKEVAFDLSNHRTVLVIPVDKKINANRLRLNYDQFLAEAVKQELEDIIEIGKNYTYPTFFKPIRVQEINFAYVICKSENNEDIEIQIEEFLKRAEKVNEKSN